MSCVHLSCHRKYTVLLHGWDISISDITLKHRIFSIVEQQSILPNTGSTDNISAKYKTALRIKM